MSFTSDDNASLLEKQAQLKLLSAQVAQLASEVKSLEAKKAETKIYPMLTRSSSDFKKDSPVRRGTISFLKRKQSSGSLHGPSEPFTPPTLDALGHMEDKPELFQLRMQCLQQLFLQSFGISTLSEIPGAPPKAPTAAARGRRSSLSHSLLPAKLDLRTLIVSYHGRIQSVFGGWKGGKAGAETPRLEHKRIPAVPEWDLDSEDEDASQPPAAPAPPQPSAPKRASSKTLTKSKRSTSRSSSSSQILKTERRNRRSIALPDQCNPSPGLLDDSSPSPALAETISSLPETDSSPSAPEAGLSSSTPKSDLTPLVPPLFVDPPSSFKHSSTIPQSSSSLSFSLPSPASPPISGSSSEATLSSSSLSSLSSSLSSSVISNRVHALAELPFLRPVPGIDTRPYSLPGGTMTPRLRLYACSETVSPGRASSPSPSPDCAALPTIYSTTYSTTYSLVCDLEGQAISGESSPHPKLDPPGTPPQTPPQTPTGAPPQGFWNEKFQAALGKLRTVQDDGTSTLDAFSRAYAELLNLNQDFIHTAKVFGKIIISEMYLPIDAKTIKPVSVGGVAGGDKYVVHGILFKFAVDAHGLYGGDHVAAGKVAGHELKGLMAYMSCEIPDVNVPLMTLIDYRGFRIIAMSVLPINNGTLIYGSCDGGQTVKAEDPVFNRRMRYAAKKLNLAKHVSANTTIYAAADIEGHRGTDGKYYLLDFSRTFPPVKPFRQVFNGHLFQLFRRDFVISCQKPLCSDIYSNFLKDPNALKMNADVDEGTEELLTTRISSLSLPL